MKLITMTQPQCLLFSAAMILNISPKDLVKELGHDGMEVWWPEYKDHNRYRTHTMQEMIDAFLKRGYALVPIQLLPMQAPLGAPEKAKPTFQECYKRFYSRITNQRAIFIGTTENGNGHAWAWSGTQVFDPRGSMCDINDLAISEAWVMHNINFDKEC